MITSRENKVTNTNNWWVHIFKPLFLPSPFYNPLPTIYFPITSKVVFLKHQSHLVIFPQKLFWWVSLPNPPLVLATSLSICIPLHSTFWYELLTTLRTLHELCNFLHAAPSSSTSLSQFPIPIPLIKDSAPGLSSLKISSYVFSPARSACFTLYSRYLNKYLSLVTLWAHSWHTAGVQIMLYKLI